MQVYMFQAALFCQCCGEAIRERLTVEGTAPADSDDESSYDSGDFPKGPFPNGGGEADSPQSCDACGEFLCNPLTGDGYTYLRDLLKGRVRSADYEHGEYYTAEECATRLDAQNRPVLATFARFYPEAWDKRNGGPI